MAFIQWRRFNFFHKQPLMVNSSGRSWDAIRESIDVLSSTCGRGFLVFGDRQGFVHMVNHNFQVSSFKAFELCVDHLYQLKDHNMLAAVGVDEEGINPVVKVWNLDKKDKLGNPFCCRVQPTSPADGSPSEVTDFVVHESLTMMAVGFQQGGCVLYKGDVAKDRRTNKVVHLATGTSDPVTGISFCGSGKSTHLFLSTQHVVMSFNLNDKTIKRNLVENRGCNARCSVMSDALLNHQFIVTSTDAVYLYEPDNRGPCFVFEGEKLLARWFNGYLILTYKDKAKSSVPSSSGMKVPEKNVVTIYDMKQKLIAFSAPLPSVQQVLYEWGSFYILTSNNSLVCLQEIDIHHKLEMLFKKNLYSLAVNLAKSQDLGEEGLVEIFKQYGDHLYSKADFDGAIVQYVKTIGHLEPSYIIRKFLDAQQIHSLTSYLQAMHERGLANEDHTTLLLNCFTKLKDEDNLNKFIMTPETALHFDVETAIRVCRQAGYYKHALQLAHKHHKHKWYLKIQLEDTQEYEKALAYIRRLPFREAEKTVKQYGKVLVNNSPVATTQLLKTLCTAQLESEGRDDDDDDERGDVSLNGEEFIHIFVNSPDMLVDFLLHLIQVKGEASPVVYNTLLELYLHKMQQADTSEVRVQTEKMTLQLLKEMTRREGSHDQALVLCQISNFREGILFLYESAQLYQQVLRYHMDHQAFGCVVDTCRRHGDKDPTLWQHALTYFAQQREQDCRQHLAQVLSHIDKNNILPPLLVVQLLARNPSATLSLVKDYILRRIQQGAEEIGRYEREIVDCREETQKMQARIEELKTSATIFQETKCSLCGHELELPSVHFLCQHAYHQHCFESYAENENECPVCAGKNRKILDRLRDQEQVLANSMELHQEFARQLQRAPDGFSLIAEYFSKGVFNKGSSSAEVEVGNQQTVTSRGHVASASMNPFVDSTLQKELLMMQHHSSK